MTSAGKMVVGSLILVASVLTAKLLHKPVPSERPAPESASTTPKLHWRVTANTTLPNELESVEYADDSSIQLTRLTSTQPSHASEFAAAPVNLADLAVGATGKGANDQRPPLPFALGQPPESVSLLVAVDHDEADDAPLDGGEIVHHTVQFGETLPQIALKYTGRSDQYMAIYQANLDVLASPAEVTPGIVLKIPLR
jgi:nucleoid-associated protein YgaU